MNKKSNRTLNGLKAGESAVIVSFAGGGEFQRRLLDMGLSIGFPVKVVQGGNGQKGPMIVQAGDTRLMLGHGMAEKIRIK